MRAVKLRSGRNFNERLVQHVYPLDLSSDSAVHAQGGELNANAPAFRPRRLASLREGGFMELLKQRTPDNLNIG